MVTTAHSLHGRSQSKILSSAFFSVILLKTRITCLQLTAIGVLVVGMMAVQYDESQHTLSEHHAEQPQNFKGIVYVFSSAGISGFLGAYLERITKLLVVIMDRKQFGNGMCSWRFFPSQLRRRSPFCEIWR